MFRTRKYVCYTCPRTRRTNSPINQSVTGLTVQFALRRTCNDLSSQTLNKINTIKYVCDNSFFAYLGSLFLRTGRVSALKRRYSGATLMLSILSPFSLKFTYIHVLSGSMCKMIHLLYAFSF